MFRTTFIFLAALIAIAPTGSAFAQSIPPNAHPAKNQRGWNCNAGYLQIGNDCFNIPAAATGKPSKRIPIKGDHCDIEVQTGSLVCVTVKDTGLRCKEAYSSDYYRGCDVEVDFVVQTNYNGRGYIDGKVECEADLALVEGDGRRSSANEDESQSFSLYANDSRNLSTTIDFSFSHSKQVRRVKATGISCRVRSPWLWGN